MKMPVQFVHSKVARRIVLLFVSCALVPVTILAVVAFLQVSSQLSKQGRKQLAQSSKQQAMAVYERMEMLDADLELLSGQLKNRTLPAPGSRGLAHFRGVTLFSQDGIEIGHWGEGARFPVLTASGKEHLAEGMPLIQEDRTEDGVSRVLLIRLAAVGNEKLILTGIANPEYVFTLASIVPDLQFCVFSSAKTAFYCSDPDVQSQTVQGSMLSGMSGDYQWESGGKSYDAAFWKLLMRPKFLTESWTVAMSRDHGEMLAPMLRFRKIFPLVILLSLWIVLLVSMVQIRRTLDPLEKLRQATGKIGLRQFDSRVEVKSGDEFEGLADALNQMAAQLGRQFNALKTVKEIDQAIFASLDRQAIIDAMLPRLPALFPSDMLSVCIFEDMPIGAWMRSRTTETGIAQTAAIRVPATDWMSLQSNVDSIAVNGRDRVPEYLSPMSQAGMRSFLILPIRVDNSLQAALICANRSTESPAMEGFQELRQVADQLTVAFSHARLIQALEEMQLGTLKALARAIDAKSEWTAGHSERVTHLALEIGRAMNLSHKELRTMQAGGLLHDIGKIGTPPSILDKAGKLTEDEMKIMQDHVRCGVRILEPIASFRESIPIVAQHHEWFDGKGYPAGLAGEDISLHARIFAVADCYDALISDRPYRKGLPKEKTVAMLRDKSGTQFDPKVIEAFNKLVEGGLREPQAEMAATAGA
jgi:putative nucleotidyltransferase with HDIG domain